MTVTAATDRARSAKLSRGFLPEVQALRAVAVLLVVVYHLWPGRLPGGFVGVDVFFVISGFLITLHLLDSLLERGRVNLARFWANRIWRLLPASLLVLIVCWIFTFLLTPVSTASNAFKQIAAASAYVVNWVLAIDSVDYLARDNVPTIVQHYWSLSVEEQFYLVWPLLLTGIVVVGTAIAAKRHINVSIGRRADWILWVILLLTASSFAYSLIATQVMPSRAYFDTFTRAWEFAAGGALAVVVMRYRGMVALVRAHPAVARWALPQLAGLGLILGSGLLMSSTTPFPSGWAAVPVLGALLIMLGGTPQNRALSAMTRWRPVQFTGDVSYSLYLWHWPLIVGFSIVASRPHRFWEGVVLLAFAFLLAWLTKIWVEDPARRGGRRIPVRWPAFLMALLGAVVLVSASVGVVQTRSAQADAAVAEQQQVLLDETSCVGANATLGPGDCADPFSLSPGVNLVHPEKDLDPDWCLTWFDQDWLSCDFGDASGPSGTVAIVGDSHAAAITNPLGEYLATEGWRLETFTRFGCPALAEAPIGLRAQTPEMEASCAAWSQRVVRELTERPDISMVIFTSFESAYSAPGDPDAATLTPGDIERTIGAVADSGKDVVVLRDFASTGGVDVPTCVASSGSPVTECSFERESAFMTAPFDEAVAALGERVRVVDPAPATCDAERCYGVVGDVVVYADDNHVSESFARSLMSYLGPALMEGAPLDARKR